MATTRVDFTREIEETYPLEMGFRVTEEQALSLGYVGLQNMVEAIAAASIQLQVPSLSVVLASSTTAELDGIEARLRLSFALPTSITDTAATRVYLVIFEPGSPVSERVLCQGSLVIRPRITA